LFHPTGKKGKLPIGVRVEGCDKLPCKFHAGHNVTLEVDFALDKTTQLAHPEVHVEVFGISTKVEIPEEYQNACKNLIAGSCPIQAGSFNTYKLSLPVEHEWVVPFSTTLRLGLLDDSHDTVLCFRAEVKVVKE
jgi:ML domain